MIATAGNPALSHFCAWFGIGFSITGAAIAYITEEMTHPWLTPRFGFTLAGIGAGLCLVGLAVAP